MRAKNSKLQDYARGFSMKNPGSYNRDGSVGRKKVREEPRMDNSIQAYSPSSAPYPEYRGRPKQR